MRLQYFQATIPPRRRPKEDPPVVVSWSPPAACSSTSISRILPTLLSEKKNPPLPSRANEKMVAPAGPRYFACGKGVVLIRQKDSAGQCSLSEESRGAAGASPLGYSRFESRRAAGASPLGYLRFEAVTSSSSLCLTAERKRLRGGVMDTDHYVDANLNFATSNAALLFMPQSKHVI